jgi:aryl-alcohol dehydrogenase-like predicted oxidoreductase
MAQVALAWIDNKVTSPIVGFSSVKRLEEAIIPDKKLTAEEMKYLEEPCVMFSVPCLPPHSFCSFFSRYQPQSIQGHA